MTENKENRRVTDKREVGKTDIWEKVYHTDARVTAMEGQIQDVHNSVSRIENLLLDKKETSPFTWFGVIFSILTLCGGLLALMSGYVNLSMMPIKEEISDLRVSMSDYSEFKHQTHYELGVVHEWKKDTIKDMEHNHERTHVLQDRVRELEMAHSRTDEKVRENDEEIKNIDLHGSRRWSSKP